MRAFIALTLLAAACGTTPPPCGPTTCAGCCTAAGTCVAGTLTQECGRTGQRCAECRVGDTCSLGTCQPFAPVGGGNVGGGSVGGGDVGGGSVGGGSVGGGNVGGGNVGGGSVGGGSVAGGSVGGGSVAGGSVGGGSVAGGSVAGGSVGGGSVGGGSVGGGTVAGGTVGGGTVGGGTATCSSATCANGCCGPAGCTTPTPTACGRQGGACVQCDARRANTCGLQLGCQCGQNSPCAPGQQCTANGCVARAWQTRTSVNPPGPRASHVMAYDSARDRVVLFGGENFVAGSFTFLNDTWEYDPSTNTWTQFTVTGPPARALATMAYDPIRGVTVLFGGTNAFSSSQRFGDTWEWNGSAWRQPTASGPPGRSQAQMAWNGARQRVVLHGGYLSNGTIPTDVWEWNGSQWTTRTGLGVGPARSAGTLTFDEDRGVLVLLSGLDTASSSSLQTGVWELGSMWSAPSTLGSGPPGRYATSAVFDTGMRATLLVGGAVASVSVGGTFVLTGNLWSSISDPAPLSFSAAVFDSRRGVVYAFGGLDTSTSRTNTLLTF